MNQTKLLLKSRNVPTEIIEQMSESQLNSAYEFIKNADIQQMGWGTQWDWNDCPKSLKKIYFN